MSWLSCLGRRARRAQRDPAQEQGKAPEIGAGTGDPQRVAVPVMDERRSPPDMTDMFLAGLPLREAVAICHAIEKQPDKPADYWWKLISPSARSAQGTC